MTSNQLKTQILARPSLTGEKSLVWMCYGMFVMLGCGAAALGPTLSYYAQASGSALSDASLLFIIKPAGFMAGSLLCGYLLKLMPLKRMLFLFLVLWVASLLLSVWLPSLALIGICLLVLAFSEGIHEVAGNCLVIKLSSAQQRRRNLNALHFFFGVGAILSPYLIGLNLEATQSVLVSYGLFSLLAAVPLILLAAGRNALPASLDSDSGIEMKLPINKLAGALVSSIFIVYLAAELTYAGWIFQYSIDQGGFSSGDAGMVAALFWMSFTAFRLLSLLYKTESIYLILSIHMLGALLASFLPLLPGGSWIIWLAPVLMGAAFSTIFPTMVYLLEKQFRLSPVLIGRIITVSMIGGLSGPWVTGQLYLKFSPHWLSYSMIIFNAIMLFMLLLLKTYTSRQHRRLSASI